MGDKYILEVESIYNTVQGSEREPTVLYKAKGFNSLVFDEAGLNKLEKFDPKNGQQEYENGYAYGYTAGLGDAWEAAKKLILLPPFGFKDTEMDEIFEKGETLYEVVRKYSAAEAVEKIKVYEEKQKAEAEIQVGDEVIINGLTRVVMKLDEKGNVDRYFSYDGRTFGNISGFQNNELKKTGRHFPEVAELLKKMKEGQEE